MLPDELPPATTAIHIGTLGLLLEPIASTLVELVRRERGRRLIMLDPNVRPALMASPEYRPRLDWFISQSTIVKASSADLAWLYPGLAHTAAAERILSNGPSLVLVTLGADGAFGATPNSCVYVSAPPVQVVDTIGAGDAFGAAALAWLHDRGLLRPHLSLAEDEVAPMLDFACWAASLTCARGGGEPPWRSELGVH